MITIVHSTQRESTAIASEAKRSIPRKTVWFVEQLDKDASTQHCTQTIYIYIKS